MNGDPRHPWRVVFYLAVAVCVAVIAALLGHDTFGPK